MASVTDRRFLLGDEAVLSAQEVESGCGGTEHSTASEHTARGGGGGGIESINERKYISVLFLAACPYCIVVTCHRVLFVCVRGDRCAASSAVGSSVALGGLNKNYY